jgi:hypothetical protein
LLTNHFPIFMEYWNCLSLSLSLPLPSFWGYLFLLVFLTNLL